MAGEILKLERKGGVFLNGKWRHARGIWALAGFLLLFFACSKNEAPSSLTQQALKEEAADAVSSTRSPVSSEGTVRKAVGQGNRLNPVTVSLAVKIMPPVPTRISPPTLFVPEAKFEKDLEFRDVRWTVNGQDYDGGKRLDPDQFRKGDSIRARGIVRAGGDEGSFSTPEVVAGNSPPGIGEVTLEPKAPTTGSIVRAMVQTEDPDGDLVNLSYQWFIDGKEVPGKGETYALAGVKKGSWVHVRVATNDGTSAGAWKFSPQYKVVNSLPVIKSVLPKEVPADRKFSYRIIAEDPDGDPLTFSLAEAPPGMVLSGTTLEWVVPGEYIGKSMKTVINIDDDDGGRTIHTMEMTFREK
jgi:hypothetical protein